MLSNILSRSVKSIYKTNKEQNELRGLSPRANYTDRATALAAKLVPTFADSACHVVSVTDPYALILGPYIGEIIGNDQHRFRHNRSTTDQIFCICQILVEKWEHNQPMTQLQEKYCTIFSQSFGYP
jgi:hypothetical protein